MEEFKMSINKKLKEKKDELEELRAEVILLEEVAEYNEKVETRGRKLLFDEPLTKRITFLVTETQEKKIRTVLKEVNIDMSTFFRGLAFGDKLFL